jgi:hypothetical protein
MGKATYKGLVPRDDPMFSTGPEVFSHLGSSESLKTSPKGISGETPVNSDLSGEPSLAPEEEKQEGALRIARFKHQNEQLLKKR